MPEDWEEGGFGLYVHWPFCMAKCPYCDFNSHVSAQIDQQRWARAYLSEIDRIGALVPGRVLRSVFFGGGTPSLMDPDIVAAIIARSKATWPCANDIEITLEANPTSVEAGRFRGYRSAGVTRISMGLQAMNDPDLKALGRLHSVAEGRAAFDIARNTFDRVSFDLIYARQNQTFDAWRSELREALAMAVDHLSLYQLTVETGTAFWDRLAAGKLRGLPDDDLAADMFDLTQEICAEHGLEAYEISNHARPGAESVHNLIYWRYGDYAGIGPGAHGRLTLNGTRTATATPRAPGAWLNAVETGMTNRFDLDPLSLPDQATEFLLMGLRIREGVCTDRLHALSGGLFDCNIKDLEKDGFLAIEANRLRVSAKGRPVLNSVLSAILTT